MKEEFRIGIMVLGDFESVILAFGVTKTHVI